MKLAEAATVKRWEALDEFRGLSVALLVLLSPLGMFKEVPDFLKHAESSGFTIVDLIAPIFLFAVGISFQVSLMNRLSRGTKVEAIKHSFYRSLILIGFGLVGEWIKYQDWQLHWGVLEMIGLSSLIALPFLFLSFRKRLLIGASFVFLWQLLLSFGYGSTVLSYDLGGPLGSIAWASIILVASGLPEDRDNLSGTLFDIALICFLASFLGNCFWPINKHLVNLPYLALSISLSSATFLFFHLKEGSGLPLLPSFGKNALLFYVLAGLTDFLLENTLSSELRWHYIFSFALVIFFVNSMLAKFLDDKRIYWKI